MAFRARKIFESFEKRTPGASTLDDPTLSKPMGIDTDRRWMATAMDNTSRQTRMVTRSCEIPLQERLCVAMYVQNVIFTMHCSLCM